jgi:hypothetical protein
MAFVCIFTDTEGMPVWETLVGLTDVRSGRCRTPRQARVLIGSRVERLGSSAAVAIRQLREVTADALRELVGLAVAREEAIAAGVRIRHARIAADVLQPGLFDRRAERWAAAQSLVLDEALGRCHARVDALSRLKAVRAESPVLRFALLVE